MTPSNGGGDRAVYPRTGVIPGTSTPRHRSSFHAGSTLGLLLAPFCQRWARLDPVVRPHVYPETTVTRVPDRYRKLKPISSVAPGTSTRPRTSTCDAETCGWRTRSCTM